MLANPTKRNKINLADYNYRRDIDNRIIMSSFSIFEVDVLREILHSSIKIPIKTLAAQLEVSQEDLRPVLEKLSSTHLLTYDDQRIIVDKEMRKYYDLQIDKFEDDFEPDIMYLQGLLNKVPIHVLPVWYSIPRMCDNIIASIIEKNLQTPKIYRHYLEELHFEDPILQGIMEDVFAASNFKVRSLTLREKYSLTREQFEEYMLHLEFNFVCYLCYTRIDGMWKEVVTPFYEWREYLQFEKESIPRSIDNSESIVRRHPQDFGFIMEMKKLLTLAEERPYPIADLQAEDSQILDKLLQVQFAEVTNDHFTILANGRKWLELSLADKAIALYRNPLNSFAEVFSNPKLFTDRNLRLVEKALKRITHCGWITFNDFMKSVIQPIGKAQPITLQKVQRGRWKYVLPSYTEEEREFIKRTIFERLFELGIIATGTIHGEPCFTLTDFGRTI